MHVAIALADAGGIESLSMRKLAAALGIEAMSLYYHVKNKSDLLDGMLDVVYSEFSTPAVGDEWRAAMQVQSRIDSGRPGAASLGDQHQGAHLTRATRPSPIWMRSSAALTPPDSPCR